MATTVSLSTSADTAVPKHHICFQALGTLANHTTNRQVPEQHKIQNTSKNALDMRPYDAFVVKLSTKWVPIRGGAQVSQCTLYRHTRKQNLLQSKTAPMMSWPYWEGWPRLYPLSTSADTAVPKHHMSLTNSRVRDIHVQEVYVTSTWQKKSKWRQSEFLGQFHIKSRGSGMANCCRSHARSIRVTQRSD